jgi:hypothetical protein
LIEEIPKYYLYSVPEDMNMSIWIDVNPLRVFKILIRAFCEFCPKARK